MLTMMIITKMPLEAMKTNYLVMAAIAAVVAMSCSKLGTDDNNVANRIVDATIDVAIEAPATRASFDQEEENGPFKVSWENDDKVVVLQRYPKDMGHEETMNEFTFNSSTFEGTIVNPKSGSVWAAFYPYAQFSGYSSSGNRVYATLPHDQDGSKDAFNSCYLMYHVNNDGPVENPAEQSPGTPLESVGLSFNLTGLTSVIKLNVPEVLNLKTIELSARDASDVAVPIAGKIKLRTAKGKNGLLNDGDGVVCKGNQTTITVEKNSGNLSGDVFIYLIPNAYDTNLEQVYYSSAKTLNFTFINEDGLQCTLPVAIDPEHPLTAATVHDFGSLPTTLPYEFDFNLTLDIKNSYNLIATGGPEGMTLSPSTVSPEDGTFTEVTVSAPGFASRKVGVYFKVWEFGKESEFVNIANLNGLTSSAAQEEGEFTVSGLTCNYYSGATIASKDSYNDLQFNSAQTTRTCLSFYPKYDAKATLGFTIASNTSAARKFFITYGNAPEETFESGATTKPVSLSIDFSSVDSENIVTMQPGFNGLRIKKIVWMEWGENVTDPASAASVSTEKVAGVLNYNF